MTCHNSSCGYQFCWICLDKAHEHTFTSTCSKFSTDKVKAEMEKLEPAKKEQRRYEHYSERYMITRQNLKFDERLKPIIDEKIQFFKSFLLDTTHLEECLRVIRRSRLALANAYVLMYYVKNEDHERDIFEDNLQYLQYRVDKLSQYLEKKLKTEKNHEEIRKELWDHICFCNQQMDKMDKQAEENLTSKKWIC